MLTFFFFFQVMAIIIKRQSVDDGGEDRAKVLSEVQRMITAAGATMQMQMVGCSVLAAIMQARKCSTDRYDKIVEG